MRSLIGEGFEFILVILVDEVFIQKLLEFELFFFFTASQERIEIDFLFLRDVVF